MESLLEKVLDLGEPLPTTIGFVVEKLLKFTILLVFRGPSNGLNTGNWDLELALWLKSFFDKIDPKTPEGWTKETKLKPSGESLYLS